MNQIDPPASPDPEWPVWIKDWVIPYISEELMWPILFAVWAHVVMGLALLVVLGGETTPIWGPR